VVGAQITTTGNGGITTSGTNQQTSNGFVKLKNPLGDTVTSLQGFLEAVLNNIVLPIGSIIIVLFIIYSGFLFVTARGNEDQIEKAKHTLLYVVIGAAILLGAVAISTAISGTVCQIAPALPNCP
jgi:predicted transporter